MSGRFAVDALEQFAIPAGPWSYRVFLGEGSAIAFRGRLSPDHAQPFQLTEDCRAPDGERLAAGVWVVIYRVFD